MQKSFIKCSNRAALLELLLHLTSKRHLQIIQILIHTQIVMFLNQKKKTQHTNESLVSQQFY